MFKLFSLYLLSLKDESTGVPISHARERARSQGSGRWKRGYDARVDENAYVDQCRDDPLDGGVCGDNFGDSGS